MKKIYLVLGLVAGLSLSSCSLDSEPSTSLGEGVAITTESDLQYAVNGIGYLMSEDRMSSDSMPTFLPTSLSLSKITVRAQPSLVTL